MERIMVELITSSVVRGRFGERFLLCSKSFNGLSEKHSCRCIGYFKWPLGVNKFFHGSRS